MMKLARILKHRNRAYGTAFEKSSGLDAQCLCRFGDCAGISTFSGSLEAKDKIYADFNVYKGKAALSASPVLPKFSRIDSGGLRVDRHGVMMLGFTPALGERKYDWDRKQLFALSVTEIGSMINLDPNGSCEFFHDPSMKSSNAGQVRKTLSVKSHGDGSGYFISLAVADSVKKINERITVPVTSAEFAVMRSAFNFALPFIMGWDRYTNSVTDRPLAEYISRSGAKPAKNDPENFTEWGR
ncbi:Single-stranded DNA-binding protein WHY2, mitochondrial-like protein [Drosera capensis]